MSAAEQHRQIEALQTLDACLAASARSPSSAHTSPVPRLTGLSIRLYHPESAPFDTTPAMEADGRLGLRPSAMRSHVGQDGSLHVVADRTRISQAFAQMDLDHARMLTRLALFWVRRVGCAPHSLSPSASGSYFSKPLFSGPPSQYHICL